VDEDDRIFVASEFRPPLLRADLPAVRFQEVGFQGGDTRRHGVLATYPTRNDRHHGLRKPLRSGEAGESRRRRRDRDGVDAGAGKGVEGVAQDGPLVQQRVELVEPAHPAARARRDQDRQYGGRGHLVDRIGVRAHSGLT
jgi:hypothetical protein